MMRSVTPFVSTSALVALVLLLWTPVAFAQVATGNLYGTVTDTDGDQLPGVVVTLAGQGAPQVQVTNAEGQFRFLGLAPGTYGLLSELEGFGTVEYPEVSIRTGANVTLALTMNAAVEDVITVTDQTPVLDERKISQGIQVTQLELQKIPTARDPWAVASQTPGVLMDRINVGGNESGQQSVFVGAGSNTAQNKFYLDGVDITDQSATGASATYFGFEQFEEMSFSTGGTDVTIQTPGVQLNMVTKRGTNEWRGSGSFNVTDEDYQSSDNLDRGDLAPGQVAAGGALTGNRIDRIAQWGIEAGGFVWRDRLWIWGAYDENDIGQTVFGGAADDTYLENTAVKLNAQLSDSNSFVYTHNEGDKVKTGRGAGPTRPPETTWNQSGPSPLQKVEDTHVFGSDFFLTASWSEIDGGFSLLPAGGLDTPVWRGADGLWHDSYYFLSADRPSERAKIDGSYFFTTGDIGHELKFGYSHRTAEELTTFGAPGNGVATDGSAGPFSPVVALAWRDTVTAVAIDYDSFWVQDTFTSDRLTVNLGLRYDLQDGKNDASSAPGSTFAPELLPALDFAGNDPGFEFEEIVPRLGVTYALGEDRKTLLRASYSQFVDQLGTGLVSEVNPLGTSIAVFLGFDIDGNGILAENEPRQFLQPVGFDPADPTAVSSPSRIDPDLDAVRTDELILGVEHAFLPELVGGFSVTWRESGDFYHQQPLWRDGDGNIAPLTAADYVLDTSVALDNDGGAGTPGHVSGTLPDGSPFLVPVYRVRDGLSDTGGVLWTNTDRQTEYLGYTVSVNKRLSNKWMLRGHVTFYDWEWSVGEGFRRFDDPTNVWNENGGAHVWSPDDDGAIFAQQSGGSGNVDLFLNSRWSFNISGLVQLPWGLNVSGNINGREGYPLPWYWDSVPTADGTKNIEVAPIGRDRVDDIITTDLRVDKDFQIGDLGVTLGLDVFNIFNEGSVLQQEFDVSTGRAGFVDQIIGPRVARIGVRLSWK
ncbi:MAG: carboxypeptidase regulatory-like domain-containing protein [Acidobacteriota bacterium]